MLNQGFGLSCFSSDDIPAAAEFYGDKLGLAIERMDVPGGPMLRVTLPGGALALIYGKEGHEPATHTVLMFEVEDLDATVADLRSRGVDFEQFGWTGEDGIARPTDGSPASAWMRDPSRNWLQVMAKPE